MQESHFFGFFFVHQEVDGLALVAELTLRVGDLRTKCMPDYFEHRGRPECPDPLLQNPRRRNTPAIQIIRRVCQTIL